ARGGSPGSELRRAARWWPSLAGALARAALSSAHGDGHGRGTTALRVLAHDVHSLPQRAHPLVGDDQPPVSIDTQRRTAVAVGLEADVERKAHWPPLSGAPAGHVRGGAIVRQLGIALVPHQRERSAPRREASVRAESRSVEASIERHGGVS